MNLKKVFLLLIFFFSFILVSCSDNSNNPNADAKSVLEAKNRLQIVYTNSTDNDLNVTSNLDLKNKDENVSISWVSSNDLVIDSTGKVTRFESDKKVILTAILSLNKSFDKKTFELNVKSLEPITPIEPIYYGTVEIKDLTIYVNSNRLSTYEEIKPVFSLPDKKEKLIYSIISEDKRALIITDDEIVTARTLATSTVRVKAQSANFLTEFNVNVIYHNYNDPDFSMYRSFSIQRFDFTTRRNKVKDILTSEHTLIIGDSFTDDMFIKTFLKPYTEEYKMINSGVNSTSTYHWEVTFNYMIGDVAPKNIVFNIGTNNFYDLNDSVSTFIASFKRLISYIHAKYPTTMIYMFNINQRTSTTYKNQVIEANLIMDEYAKTLDYLTMVESNLINSDLSDGIHPTAAGYKKMFDALFASGIDVVKQ